ncbi:hypothetical protein JANAI62_14630 [Jannaschia pagri]|uniref:protein-tyrosine-phosphatase n=1 Tax=Jannaschia pagri TaxID=2829797 RepID=A0ABQ4NK91_9RHOB|nr:hypothetical protein JANAI62_14630 [Jannaschia sp. AI_62]
MRAHTPDLQIDSAGTGAWHVGDPPYAPMQRALKARGYDVSAQRARQIQTDDLQRFDRVLAMDASVLADLRALRNGSRAELFGVACGLGQVDVPDPYYTGDYETCLDLIERGCARLA